MAKKKPSTTRPKVNKSHGWYIGVFIAGTLLPPIAVAMRFGFTRDFFINVVFTILGYFPSHIHNYLQNIRNNKNRGRTPQWAIKNGLIEPDKIQSQQWQHKYSERTNDNIYEDDEAASIHSAGSIRNSTTKRSGGIERARADRYSTITPKKDSARELERVYGDDDASSLQSHSIRRQHSFSSTHSQSLSINQAPTKKKSFSLFGSKKKDRFERERDALQSNDTGHSRAQTEYQDEFEREINGGSNVAPNRSDSYGREDEYGARGGREARPLAARVPDDGLHHTF